MTRHIPTLPRIALLLTAWTVVAAGQTCRCGDLFNLLNKGLPKELGFTEA